MVGLEYYVAIVFFWTTLSVFIFMAIYWNNAFLRILLDPLSLDAGLFLFLGVASASTGYSIIVVIQRILGKKEARRRIVWFLSTCVSIAMLLMASELLKKVVTKT